MKKAYPANKARAIATQTVAVLVEQGMAHWAEIAGSLRRQVDTVHDVDLVVFPVLETVQAGLWAESDANFTPGPLDRWLASLVETTDGRVAWIKDAHGNVRQAKDMRTVVVNGIPVEFYLTTPMGGNWGALLQMRTGPAEWNIGMAVRCAHLGLQYRAGYGIFRGDTRVDNDTEEGIFLALGLPANIPPRRRHDPALIAALKAGTLTMETMMRRNDHADE